MSNMRADVFLAESGYVQSRQRARVLIEGGFVTIDGKKIPKAAYPIEEGEHTVEVRDPLAYVGRGGLKLEAALKAFSVDVTNARALDIGASTGGFTDCLLQRGAKQVYAIDAGIGQLAEKLRQDSRVISLEHKNARELSLEDIGGKTADLAVMDVSFISSTYILPRFPQLLRKGGHAVVLIKPQFEVGKQLLGKGGIVKDPRGHRLAVERVWECGASLGLTPVGLISSPIAGGDGNREFLIHFIYQFEGNAPVGEDLIRRVTAPAH